MKIHPKQRQSIYNKNSKTNFDLFFRHIIEKKPSLNSNCEIKLDEIKIDLFYY